MRSIRPTIDQTMMNTAVEMAKRSTCPRKAVGAIIATTAGNIVASGYNGTVRGAEHCGHGRLGLPCKDAVHAEVNAVFDAARRGVAVQGLTMWTTLAPCLRCAHGLVQSGIAEVSYLEPYRDTAGIDLLSTAGIHVGRHRD